MDRRTFYLDHFRDEMQKLGYAEGKDYELESYFASGDRCRKRIFRQAVADAVGRWCPAYQAPIPRGSMWKNGSLKEIAKHRSCKPIPFGMRRQLFGVRFRSGSLGSS
jgi:hypothetical protein